MLFSVLYLVAAGCTSAVSRWHHWHCLQKHGTNSRMCVSDLFDFDLKLTHTEGKVIATDSRAICSLIIADTSFANDWVISGKFA